MVSRLWLRVLLLPVLAACLIAGLVGPVEGQGPADRAAVERARAEAREAELSDPGVPGPEWIPDDPDRPSPETLAGIDSGPSLFDPGPRVLPPGAQDVVNQGAETAKQSAPRAVVTEQPIEAPFDGPNADRRTIVPVVTSERVEFEASADSEKTSGRAETGSVLEDRVRLTRPEQTRGEVALQVANKTVTERLSSAGLAFSVETEVLAAVGDVSRLAPADGPADLGDASGWELEFDLDLFADVLMDPTSVEFVVNIGCDADGNCEDREFLNTTVDVEAWTATVELPANVVAGFDRSSRTLAPPTVGAASAGGGLGLGVAGSGVPGLLLFQGGNPNGGLVIGAVQGPHGSGGTYAASRLGSVASWQVGLRTGYAELQYPLALPSAPGPVPNIDLGYSSGLVEGNGSTDNGQPPRVGLGWSEPVSVITRATRACDPDPDRLCAAFGRHDGFSLAFNGVSSPLVRISADAGETHPDYPSSSGVTKWEYILESRNDWRVRRVEQPSSFTNSNTSNGDGYGTWWEVTTGDGTLHVFGRERAFDPDESSPGPSTTWERGDVYPGLLLGSLLSAPLVFIDGVGDGGSPADPDRPPHGCTGDFCDVGIVWHLDQVIDTSGNRAVYHYDYDSNHIEPTGWTTRIRYDREVRLDSIHWGQRYESAPPAASGSSPFKVNFNYQGRHDVPNFGCTLAGVGNCQSIPAFYSDKVVDRIMVLVNNTEEYGWDLTLDMAVNDPVVWLREIQRIQPDGAGGYQATIPPVEFTKQHLDNALTGGQAYSRPRIKKMTTEAGAEITFSYDQPYAPTGSCAPGSVSEVRPPCNMFPSPETFSQADNGTLIWWNQYVVDEVTVSPTDGGSADIVTSYSYDTHPDWAWQARYPGAGEWNDYRGHRQVTVDDNDGTEVTHYFATGMYDDRSGPTDDDKFGVDHPTAAAVKIHEPWEPSSVARNNYEAIAGESIGTRTVRNSTTHSFQVTRFEVEDVTTVNLSDGVGNRTPVITDFSNAHRVTDSIDWTQIYNGETGYVARTKVEQFYDDYQRIELVVDHGQTTGNNGATTVTGDERTTETVYDDHLDSWILDLVDKADTYEGTDTTGTMIASVRSDFDDRGRVTETRTQRASNSTDRQKTNYSYTYRGQLEEQISRGENGNAADDQTTLFEYDSTYGWLKKVNGPLGGTPDPDTSHQVVDPVFGVVTQSTDVNGRVTDYEYDEHGRLTAVILPGTPTGYKSYEFTYHIAHGAVDRVETKQLVNHWSNKYAISWEFFDGLGRLIQTQWSSPAT